MTEPYDPSRTPRATRTQRRRKRPPVGGCRLNNNSRALFLYWPPPMLAGALFQNPLENLVMR